MVSSILWTKRMPRVGRGAAFSGDGLGRLGLDLVDVAGRRCAGNGDTPRLHGFRDLANEFDGQQAVVERGAFHLDIFCEVELPLETAGRDTAIEEITLSLVGFAAFD